MNKLRTAITTWLASKLNYLEARNLVIWNYKVLEDTETAKVFDLIARIKEDKLLGLYKIEAYHIYMAVKKTEKITGDLAEVGVYRGGSAKLICEAKGNRNLHLFDTFEGLPELSENDNSCQFHKGQYGASIESVRNYLKQYPNVHIYKGLFPATGEPVKNRRFSFVHLDVDIYQSTLDSLEFFYPLMNKGGVIISHDYITVEGVREAFDEFFREKPETIIELAGSQCWVVKLD